MLQLKTNVSTIAASVALMYSSHLIFADADIQHEESCTVEHCVTDTTKPDGTWVGGYYSSWSYWQGKASVKDLSMIQEAAGSANYMVYAFLGITTNKTLKDKKTLYNGIITLNDQQQGASGTIVDVEALADKISVGKPTACPAFPDDESACSDSSASTYMKDYAKASMDKTILLASIGGWSYTPRFNEFYKDYKANLRVLDRFINSAENWLKGHPEFSGISVDWEYPGYGHGDSHKGHEGEGILYTEMITQLRVMLDKLEAAKNKHYYLTTAVVASAKKAKGQAEQGVDWQKVANSVDWLDLMAFDLHGEFDAPAPKDQAVAQSMSAPKELQEAINYYTETGKIPARKIILGMPAYAREMLIADEPTESNKYGYLGNLKYPGFQGYADAFKNTYYHGKPEYYDYQDNPNPEPYYPAGGMVDFTGAYHYQCFLSIVTDGKAKDNCYVLKNRDNRGALGQLPPEELRLSYPEELTLSYPEVNIAWLSGSKKNVAANFDGAPSSGASYPAYPVFTLDTQKVVSEKAEKLVKANNLGGMWFWELTGDALKSPEYSLFLQACKQLGHKGKCLTH